MRTLSIALLIVTLASCRSGSSAVADAGPPARPKIVRPRVLASGEMPIELAQSSLKLVIVKDHVTPVPATLSMRDGALALDAPSPNAHLSIDLDTFQSSIAIRDERVRNIIFETSAIGWESAELAFDLPADLVAKLRSDKKLTQAKLVGKLKVHGSESTLPVTIDAGYDGPKVWVKSSAPVDVKVSDLGLTDNLHRLNAICMHDAIDDVVKVDVSILFTP